jgi:hypothetical protein
MHLRALASCLLLLSSVASQRAPAQAVFPPHVSDVPVASFAICDAWAGLGKPRRANYVIARGPDGFVLSGAIVEGAENYKGGEVERPVSPVALDDAAVARLGRALRAPSLPRDAGLADVAGAGFTGARIDAEYVRLLRGTPGCSPEARTLFTNAMRDRAWVRASLEDIYESWHTDDNPGVRVDVVYADGSRASATTRAQPQLMLPWQGEGGETWNPELARALAAVLPGDSPNVRRLRGDRLFDVLADRSFQRIARPWNELEGRCRFAAVLASFARDGWSTIAVTAANSSALNVQLRRADFPPNLHLHASLFVDSMDAELASFRALAGGYADRAVAYAKTHPHRPLRLQYYRNASLTDIDARHLEDDDIHLTPDELSRTAVLDDPSVGYSAISIVLLPDGRDVEID